VIGQATTIGRSEAAEDDTDASAETSAAAADANVAEPTPTSPEVQSPVLSLVDSATTHPVRFFSKFI
jgi:hypothetical protein